MAGGHFDYLPVNPGIRIPCSHDHCDGSCHQINSDEESTEQPSPTRPSQNVLSALLDYDEGSHSSDYADLSFDLAMGRDGVFGVADLDDALNDVAIDDLDLDLDISEVPSPEPSSPTKDAGESEKAAGRNLMMHKFLTNEPGPIDLRLTPGMILQDFQFHSPDEDARRCISGSSAIHLSPSPEQVPVTHEDARNVGHSPGRRPPPSYNVVVKEDFPYAKIGRKATGALPSDTFLDDQSISGSSLPESSRVTEDDFYSVVLSHEHIRNLRDSLRQVFGQFIDSRLGLRTAQQHGCGLNSSHGRSDLVDADPHSNAPDGTNNNKRRRRGNDDEDASRDGPGGNGSGPIRCKEDSNAKQKIACPFMKRFPEEFSTWRTCVGPGFDGLHRMKEHLKRRHFKEYSCQRCHLNFESNRQLQSHIRSLEPCVLRETQNEIGFMTQVQWDDINKRKGSRTSVLDRWKEIYVILFPDVDADYLPGPYFETAEVMDNIKAAFDIDEYSVHLGRHLPWRVFARLNEEFRIMSDAAKERLVEILQEEALECLRSYILQGEAGQPPNSSAAGQSAEREATTWPTDMFEGIDLGTGEHLDFSFLLDDVQPDKGKGRADSAYGSNVMEFSSGLAPEEAPSMRDDVDCQLFLKGC